MNIRAARIKLTLLYVLVIFLISAFFSANLYRISIQEVGRGFERQERVIKSVPRLRGISDDPDFMRIRLESYNDAKATLLRQLVITNLVILSLGGLLSYIFAMKTLEPIERAHDAQSRFTSDASHELRTPISVIKSEVEVALRNKKLTPGLAREVLQSNLEEVDRVDRLIDRLLLLARTEDDLPVKSTSLQHVLNEAIKSVEPIANSQKTIIESRSTNLKVLANPDYLVQAFAIVLDNAVKYSPINSKIIVDISSDDKCAMIDITDQGSGVDPNDAQKIFERFYRSDSSRSKQNIDGQGLGLAIARNILEKQKGSIDLQSTSPKGSTFRITLQKKN